MGQEQVGCGPVTENSSRGGPVMVQVAGTDGVAGTYRVARPDREATKCSGGVGAQTSSCASPISTPAKFKRQRTRFSAALLQVISIAISLKWVGRFLCSPASGDLYCDLTEVGCHGSLTQHWMRKLEFL